MKKTKKKIEYAGFGIRLLATIVDGLVIIFISRIFGRTRPLFFNRTFNILIGALYSILLLVNWNGQTIGKRLVGIKVVKENQKPVGYPEAFLRYIGYMISSAVLGLGFLWIIWDERKQGWHDKIAKTVVIQAK